MATTTQPVIHQVPDWETPTSPPKQSILSKINIFSTASNPPNTTTVLSKEETLDNEVGSVRRTWSDKWLPHWASCMGRSRKHFFCSIVALVFLLALALGLGLGLGLNHKLKKAEAQDLPLPTNGGIYTGDLTYYSPGPGYGACGYENSSTDAICAVSHIIWDAALTSSDPNDNPLCGQMIRITRYDSTVGGNRSVDVEVVDKCMACAATDLDLSLSMFDDLAEQAQGRVVGSWAWLT